MKTWQALGLGIGGATAAIFFGKKVIAYFHTPARAMTVDQALTEMRKYAQQGIVQIIQDGSPMVIGGLVNGVQHNYAGNQVRNTIDNLDPRLGVFLVRLDQMLKSKYKIDTFIDYGITHGGDNPMDCHNQGRAIDFAGALGPNVDVNIQRDWGNKSSSGSGYRLSKDDNGYKMFLDIYNFATAEGADRSCDTIPRAEGPPTKIGDHSCVITPDHPDPSLRTAHQNHIHMQIGRTVGVEP
jgi:hypothetical protein